MIWFILAAIITIWVTIQVSVSGYRYNKDHPEWASENEGVGAFFVTLILSVIVALVLNLGVGCFYQDVGTHENRTYIVSLSDSVGSRGAFALGSGRISSEMYYFYYVYAGAGYKVEHTTASGLVLFDDQKGKTAYLVEYYPNVELKMWGIKFGSSKDSELHIPKGTIIKNVYDLDLK